MAELNEVQALEKVSTEVDKSQVKIILSSTCIKAQAFLYDKLKKESERLKEICTFISSSNSKLETEIQFSEQEIKSLNLAFETIRVGNIELQKAYFLSKERKVDIFERTKVGIKKYESIWATSKDKYESIPFIKKMIDAKNKSQLIQTNIDGLINESKDLANKIEKKRNELFAIDKAQIIELANFIVFEKAKILKSINEQKNKIKVISKELQICSKQQKNINTSNLANEQSLSTCHNKQVVENIKDNSVDDNWSNLSKNIDKDTLVLPRLHLQNNDLDILSIKLDEIKKVDLQNISSVQRSESFKSLDLENDSHKKRKAEEITKRTNISSYFDNLTDVDAGYNEGKVKSMKYSDKKLIHIIENVKLDKNDTYNIICKLEPQQFQETKYITSTVIKHSDSIILSQEKINKSIEIEEIDLTSKEYKYEAGAYPSQFIDNAQFNKPVEIEKNNLTPKEYNYEAVAPPSQFVDNTQCTQEKKTVSFNIPNEEKLQILCEGDLNKSQETEVKSQEKMLNISTTIEDNYATIKDMILKKHNLDLSPQFVYTKNTLQQMNSEQKVVTSKFFENKAEMNLTNDVNKDDNIKNQTIHKNTMEGTTNEDLNLKMKQNVNIGEEPITGLLFNHGPEGITDSINISINTTGFNDSEDFPHCIDANIMLSPKADLPSTAGSTRDNEVMSQEVPNFLAGFRKKGLSLFGFSSTSNQKPDSSAQNQNSGFTFTFGNEEKKDRGGLFSMFR